MTTATAGAASQRDSISSSLSGSPGTGGLSPGGADRASPIRPGSIHCSFRRASGRGAEDGDVKGPLAFLAAAPLAAAAVLLAGCGSGGSSGSGSAPATQPAQTSAATAPKPATRPSSGPSTGGSTAAPLTAEAQSAAAGDIPDNQVFLTFRDRAAGYSIKYPEGWAQRGSGMDVSFRDKNNLVRVVVEAGRPATAQAAQSELRRLRASTPSLRYQTPTAVTLAGSRAVKVVYTTASAPNPVTGKRVTLVVDRYYLAHGGRRATVDLGVPKGVDNVDAYRLMIESFRWR